MKASLLSLLALSLFVGCTSSGVLTRPRTAVGPSVEVTIRGSGIEPYSDTHSSFVTSVRDMKRPYTKAEFADLAGDEIKSIDDLLLCFPLGLVHPQCSLPPLLEAALLVASVELALDGEEALWVGLAAGVVVAVGLAGSAEEPEFVEYGTSERGADSVEWVRYGEVRGIPYLLFSCDPPQANCRRYLYRHANMTRGGTVHGTSTWADSTYRSAAESAILRFLLLLEE